MCPGRLCEQRFLFSLHKESLGKNGWQRLKSLARRLRMPAEYEARMLSELVEADIIHLGYEGSDDINHSSARICKVYLEFTERFFEKTGALAKKSTELLHLAFKWDANNPSRRTVTHYRCQPNMSGADLEAEINQAFPASVDGAGDCGIEGKKLSLIMLQQAYQRIDAEELLLMQVVEEGNRRYSFDLNLYDAEMTLVKIEPTLAAVAELLDVPEAQWRKWFEAHSDEVLGHMAAGTDRDGELFFSFYFGVESRQPR
jgi:hypothetical protein